LPAQELQYQQLELMPDASLAAMQQQNIAELLASVAEYVQRTVQTVQPLRYLPEDSLAAAQQHQMVDVIREITRYLTEDLNVMKQTCKALTANIPLLSQSDHAAGSKAGFPAEFVDSGVNASHKTGCDCSKSSQRSGKSELHSRSAHTR